MRLSDITAGVRAAATAHCYNRAAMHRSAKCRYGLRDQKIGKQRKNERMREEKEKENERERNGFVSKHVSGELESRGKKLRR